MRVGSSTTISDADLVTYNVKELNRVLKSKGGDYSVHDDGDDGVDDCHIDENDNRKTTRQENCANLRFSTLVGNVLVENLWLEIFAVTFPPTKHLPKVKCGSGCLGGWFQFQLMQEQVSIRQTMCLK